MSVNQKKKKAIKRVAIDKHKKRRFATKHF